MRRSIVITVLVLILLAAIGGGIYFFIHRSQETTASTNLITPVTLDDHILGNPAAPILLVEYCDIDSPYCKNFQTVMEGVIANYGKDGRVAWVYRHLPLTDQYPGSEDAAEASECAAAQGGTDIFFKFIDAVDTAAPGSASLDASNYTDIAHTLGIDPEAFSTCFSNHAYADLIAKQSANAISAGADGAPYTVLLVHGQPTVPLQGGFSYDQMQQVIDAVLAKLAS